MPIRTIIAKYAGKCNCCGGLIAAGTMIDYDPKRKVIAHHKGWEGNSAACTAHIRRDRDFVDLDRMYEDQCADICGR
jgi:hypothetical protein